jgi:hypothetical protein
MLAFLRYKVNAIALIEKNLLFFTEIFHKCQFFLFCRFSSLAQKTSCSLMLIRKSITIRKHILSVHNGRPCREYLCSISIICIRRGMASSYRRLSSCTLSSCCPSFIEKSWIFGIDNILHTFLQNFRRFFRI